MTENLTIGESGDPRDRIANQRTEPIPFIPSHPYRLWVNDERTVMVEVWTNGTATVATRDHPSHTWGPPTMLAEENVQ
jgi:hypothetical protein